MRQTESGAFSSEFAAKKHWKLDPNLLDAINGTLLGVPKPGGCSVIDCGAGIGKLVLAIRDAGWLNVEGVDGIPGIDALSGDIVSELDLTMPYVWSAVYGDKQAADAEEAPWRPDVAICIEVGEHIPEAKQKQFLDNLADAACQVLIVSYAVPGQRGRDHVCCRSPEWVANQLGRRGWSLAEDKTANSRLVAGKGWNKKLLVLEKATTSDK